MNHGMTEIMENQQEMVFASYVFPSVKSEINAVLFLRSIRAFGGEFSDCPVWFFVPKIAESPTSVTSEIFSELKAEVFQFDGIRGTDDFPFIGDSIAAAFAENKAMKSNKLLAWLAANTLILGEPKAFYLAENKALGYRPVHHKLIGSPWREPIDEFWKWVYDYCGVSSNSLFPMVGHIDGHRIRPYFNAGSIVLRPQHMVLQSWKDTFLEGYNDPRLQHFYSRNEKYAIFVHQAILSGVILSRLRREELVELPATYNYPLHLFFDDITNDRRNTLDEYITVRHEGFYQNESWAHKLPASTQLKKWIAQSLIHQ